MKKVYIQPIVAVLSVCGEAPLANSMKVDSENKVSRSTDIGFVKGDNNSRGNYNVWNDDWSE